MPQPDSTKTTGEMLEEVIDLTAGFALLLPLFLLAVPCAILLLPLALPLIPLAILAAPYMLFRWVWRRLRRPVPVEPAREVHAIA
jgi:hypothetical protein